MAHRLRQPGETGTNAVVQPIDKVGRKDDNEGCGFSNQKTLFEFYDAVAKFLASPLQRG